MSKDADCHCGGRHAWLTRHRNAKPSSVISMDFCYDRRIISEPAQLGDMKWNLSGIRYISLVSRWPYDTNACEVRREKGLSRGELTTVHCRAVKTFPYKSNHASSRDVR